ncbi:hypothetical protein L915_09007 [Phytophthora nicotianae]|uniref:Uncharacterized protein n=1 Tax=Phytophthora nicotianae TaxID=4792 RepID=W2GTM9_PHYNI|nr:hypothetical protein L915_09007 [Phytophthora nicotianae]
MERGRCWGTTKYEALKAATFWKSILDAFHGMVKPISADDYRSIQAVRNH